MTTITSERNQFITYTHFYLSIVNLCNIFILTIPILKMKVNNFFIYSSSLSYILIIFPLSYQCLYICCKFHMGINICTILNMYINNFLFTKRLLLIPLQLHNYALQNKRGMILHHQFHSSLLMSILYWFYHICWSTAKSTKIYFLCIPQADHSSCLRSNLYFPLIYFALNAANCASSNDIPSPWK